MEFYKRVSVKIVRGNRMDFFFAVKDLKCKFFLDKQTFVFLYCLHKDYAHIDSVRERMERCGSKIIIKKET